MVVGWGARWLAIRGPGGVPRLEAGGRPGRGALHGLGSPWRDTRGGHRARLMEICPILMGRFLRAKATGAPREEMRAVYRKIRAQIEADLRFEVCDFVGSEDDVRDGIQRMTGLDPAFLKILNAVGVAAVFDLPAAGEFDQRPNLDLAASQFTACRLLLALDLLESLEAGEPTHWKGGPCGSPRRLEADRLVAAQARRFHRG